MPDLAAILDSNGPHRTKTIALLAAVERRDPEVLPLARARVDQESDTFVRATLISVLGSMGDASDRERIAAQLGHGEARVVANALSALLKLGLNLTLEEISGHLDHPDARVQGEALKLLAGHQPDRVLERVSLLLPEAGEVRAGAMCRVLAVMFDDERARTLMLRVFDLTPNVGAWKQASRQIQESTRRKHATEVLAHLHDLRDRSEGDRRSIVAQLLHDLAVSFGWSEADVHAAASSRAAQVRSRAEVRTPASPAPSPEPSVPDAVEPGASPAPARSTGKIPIPRIPSRPSRKIAIPAPAPQPPSTRPTTFVAVAVAGALCVGVWRVGSRTPDAPVRASVAPGLAGHSTVVPATTPLSSSVFSASTRSAARSAPRTDAVVDVDGWVISARQGEVMVRGTTGLMVLVGSLGAGLRRGERVRARARVTRVDGRLVRLEALP